MLLRGTEGADVLTGAGEDDTIYGFGGADTLRGGAGDDVLAGNDGNDKLYGGDGDDYILGGPGDDLIDGGAGNDWAAYEDATAGVTVDLTKTGQQNTGGGGRDTLVGIENLYGSDFNDTLIGDAGDNMLVGGKGNDTLSGGKGDDTLWGSEGNDTLDGGDGDDYLVGGAGDDIIKGGAGWDWSSYEDAGAGVTVDLTKTGQQDTIGAGKDTLSGIEHLYGSKFNDVLTGDANNNYLWGDAGDDKLYGGKGDDHLSGGVGVNILDGGEGWDTIDYAFAQTGVEIDLSRNFAQSRTGTSIRDTLASIEAVMGSAFDDIIVGNAAENYIYGDAGNDMLAAIGGHDTLDGGDGDDLLIGSNLGVGDLMLGGAGNDTIIVCAGSYGEVAATVDGGADNDTLQFNTDLNVTFDLRSTAEQLFATGSRVTAQNIENVTGGEGNDRITGDAGDNVIEGRGGNDILDGGAGFDIASYASAASAVRVDLAKAGIAQDTRGAGTDTLANFEGLKGSKYGDILIGDAGDNSFEGGAGHDIIDGGAGNDTAIYSGVSTDYTWTRNTNGTWTVRGLEGVDTLLNIETLKFIDKSIALAPLEATVTVDDLVTTREVLDLGNYYQDVILSADGQTAYISDIYGYVRTWSPATGLFLTGWKVGESLGAIDLSLNGRYLVATERSIERDGTDLIVTVHVLDLSTGAVAHHAMPSSDPDWMFNDAAFMSDGRILLTQHRNGAGERPLTILDPSTGVFTKSPGLYDISTTLTVSGDHSKVLLGGVLGIGGVGGPLYVFSASEGETGGLANASSAAQAISGNGALIASYTGAGELNVYDGDLKFVTNLLATTPQIVSVYGMDFTADGKRLFVVDPVLDQVFEFSTSSWTLERVYALTTDVQRYPHSGLGDLYGNRVSVSADGGQMLIFDGYVTSIDFRGLEVESAKPVTLVGGAGNDILRGSAGNDVIQGGAGDDVLIGGKGIDTLSGGAGADVFQFFKGDSSYDRSLTRADVVTDFAVDDKLAFANGAAAVTPNDIRSMGDLGPLSSSVKLMVEAYASQYETANFSQKYMVFGAGADTYVLADTDDVRGYDQVVQLKNFNSSLFTPDMIVGL